MQTSLRSVVSAALGLIAAACSMPGGRVQVGYLSAELSGTASLEASSGGLSAAARADVEDTFGLREPSDSIYLRAEFDAGLLRVTASGFRYEQTGTGLLEASFGDLAAGTLVTSDLRLGAAKAAVTFDVIDVGGFRLSPGIGVDLLELDATVSSQSIAQSERVDEILPMPLVVLQGEVDFGPAAVVVEVGGMDVELGDLGGQVWDAEAMLSLRPTSIIELFAGYRWISVDAHGLSSDRDFRTDFELQGWFAGGGFTF